MYLALGIVFLICSLLIAAGIALTLIKSSKHGGDLISKKNLLYLAPTFVIIYSLHITAAVYNGDKINFFYCFNLIYTVLEVLKFKVQVSFVSPICEAYPIFYVDFVLAFIVGGITVILSVASFFSRRISNGIKVRRATRSGCDVVVGDSANSVRYVQRTKNSILLGTDISSQRYTELLKQGVPVLKMDLGSKRLPAKLNRGGYNVIVFRDSKYSYSKIMSTFAALGCDVKIHLEANQQEMKVLKQKFIMKADNNSKLFVTGFSKYELMARRFVADYPVSKYVPRSFYNENCTLKDGKQINVVFIGFGKVNYQLFRMCAMQFQFARQDGDRLVSKPVKYHIYDNQKAALHNEFFSRILFEFDEEFKNCDFPKPEKICDVNIRPVDINSVEAKKEFKALVNEDSFTYFIVSLDNDLEDASYAHTVKRLFGENTNYNIFVRAKNHNGERLNDDIGDDFIYFGEEKKLYTHENIVNDDLTELAQRINLLYNNISNPPEWLKELKKDKNLTADEQRKILNEKLASKENRDYMIDGWNSLPNIEQDSNLYHALNLPFKLNLLGFDMVKDTNGSAGVSEKQFNEYYKNSGRDSGYADYSFFFKTESSNVLAFIEHSRWNALYILYDYKQMKKEDMRVLEEQDEQGNTEKVMPHKDTAKKQHACLTTYYGLDELIKFKYKALYGGEPGEKNYRSDKGLQKLGKIYAYDYMDLDRLYREITAMGYKLIRNGSENQQ